MPNRSVFNVISVCIVISIFPHPIQLYKDFFDAVIKEIHNFGPADVHPAKDLDAEKVFSAIVSPTWFGMFLLINGDHRFQSATTMKAVAVTTMKTIKLIGIHRQMPTPIDSISVVFHEWGLGPYPKKPQAEWDMPQAFFLAH